MRRFIVLTITGALLAAPGCGSDAKSSTPKADAAADGAVPDAGAEVAQLDVAATDAPPADVTTPDFGNPDCDPLMPAACAMPWPSNLYLKADATRKTGFTLTFGATTLPKNGADLFIDPAPYKRLDGYSLGSPLLVLFPNLDVKGLASEGDLAPSIDKAAAIVWLEVDDKGKVLRHVPYFAELDANEKDTAKKTLLVRPAVILKEATRYVIGMRGLKNTTGKAFARSPAFDLLATGKTAGTVLAPRQARFDELLGILDSEGVKKADLTIAWDFVTGSMDGLTGTLRDLRDKADAVVGDKGPELTITEVIPFTEAQNVDIAYEVTGTFHVPHYLDPKDLGDGVTGWRFHYGADGKVVQNGWRDAVFLVRIPRAALKGDPMGLVEYGHGLTGSEREVRGGWAGRVANTYGLIYFSCRMIGMAEEDTAAIFKFINNMTEFPLMPERLHQGMIEHLMLARAMRERFADLPQIQKLGVKVDKKQLFYEGCSQGGIYGGVLIALSKDMSRAQLGEPGQNYSTLLHRSVDFEEFNSYIRGVYPATIDQNILLSSIQLLWDTVDPVSYLRHIKAEPFPGNTAHDVLMVIAQGDYQVAPVTDEITVRSALGIELMKNYGRPVWDVKETEFPLKGSGLMNFSFGNPWAPYGNVPPEDLDKDPHDLPRKDDKHNEQMVHFLRTGEIIDVCGGDGCKPN